MELLITFILGLFFIVGIAIVRFADNHTKIEEISLSLACGALVALAIIDLIPEIIETYAGPDSEQKLWQALIFILIGFFILKFIDLYIPDHHGEHHSHGGHHGHGTYHGQEDHEHQQNHRHPHHDAHEPSPEESQKALIHIGVMTGLALILHNILEGMTVYNISALDTASGISFGIGVGLHNIPLGMLIYATLSGEKPVQKYVMLFLSVISTFLGGLLMYFASPYLSKEILSALTCITFGMVLFIIFCELVPSVVHSKNPMRARLYLVLGFLFVCISGVFG